MVVLHHQGGLSPWWSLIIRVVFHQGSTVLSVSNKYSTCICTSWQLDFHNLSHHDMVCALGGRYSPFSWPGTSAQHGPVLPESGGPEKQTFCQLPSTAISWCQIQSPPSSTNSCQCLKQIHSQSSSTNSYQLVK